MHRFEIRLAKTPAAHGVVFSDGAVAFRWFADPSFRLHASLDSVRANYRHAEIVFIDTKACTLCGAHSASPECAFCSDCGARL